MSKITIKATNDYRYNVLKDEKQVAYVYMRNTQNCKLKEAEFFSRVVHNNSLNNNEKIEVITKLLINSYTLMLFMHLSDKATYEFLNKHFKLAYCVAVPVGYYNKYQYHICVINEQDDRFTQYFENRDQNNKTTELLLNQKNNTNSISKEIASIEKDGLKTVKGVLNRLKRKFNL